MESKHESEFGALAEPYLTHKDRRLKVCWLSSELAQDSQLRQEAKSIVLSEWQKKTVVDFIGWEFCNESSGTAHIRILLMDDYRPASCLGNQRCQLKDKFGATMVLSPTYYSKFLSCRPGWTFFDSWGEKKCFRQQVLHEFGHALGLEHEQERYDSKCKIPGTNMDPALVEPMGPYDSQSIMNYCHPALKISSLDSEAVNALYLRKDFDFWGRMSTNHNRCLTVRPSKNEVPELSLEKCKEDRSQIWGLKQNGVLHSLAGQWQGKPFCLAAKFDRNTRKSFGPEFLGVFLASCRRNDIWLYSKDSGQLSYLDSKKSKWSLTPGPLGELILKKSEADSVLPKNHWSWQGMLESHGTELTLYPSQGGTGGIAFDDRPFIHPKDPPVKLLVYAGQRIHGIAMVYSSGNKLFHGGKGGKIHEMNLDKNELISWMQIAVYFVNENFRVVGLRVTTSNGKNLSVGSFPGEANYFSYSPGLGQGIYGFYGRAGKEIDQLGIYTAAKPLGEK